MLEEAFQHRSGRIIAFGRAVLAVFFFIIIWVDRTQPHSAVAATYIVLALYAAAALALLFATWDHWWLEAKLALPFHVVDMLVFLWLNYATQGYASPFFTFFVFLIFSATFHWDWRAPAATAAVIILLYILSAVTAASWGTEAFDWRRFALRSAYLVVLTSMTILWIASTRHRPQAGLEPGAGDAGDPHPDLEPLLRLAAERFGATRALALWSEAEEPWTWVSRWDGARFAETRLEPDAWPRPLSAEAGQGPFLFDQGKGRILARAGGRRKAARALEAPLEPGFAAAHHLDRGLRIPLRSGGLEGELFLLGVPGLCSDDVERAEELAAELAAGLEHRELIQATQEAAAIRARLAVARDLHDSVVQFLAGLAFRLEGVRKVGAAGGDVSAEVDALQAELVREQQDLRRLIAELREDPALAAGGRAELVASLRELSGRIAAQWDVVCRVAAPRGEIDVPVSLERNLRQIVREAVANAVRHGRATAVETRLGRAEGTLEVEISDNGSGFPFEGERAPEELAGAGPTSLWERVQNLGGRLRIASGRSGSRLSLELPLEEAP